MLLLLLFCCCCCCFVVVFRIFCLGIKHQLTSLSFSIAVFKWAVKNDIQFLGAGEVCARWGSGREDTYVYLSSLAPNVFKHSTTQM